MTPSESRMCGITVVVAFFFLTKHFSLENKDLQKMKLWERDDVNSSSDSGKDNWNKVWRLLKYSIVIF